MRKVKRTDAADSLVDQDPLAGVLESDGHIRNIVMMRAQVGEEDVDIVIVGNGNDAVRRSDTALLQNRTVCRIAHFDKAGVLSQPVDLFLVSVEDDDVRQFLQRSGNRAAEPSGSYDNRIGTAHHKLLYRICKTDFYNKYIINIVF